MAFAAGLLLHHVVVAGDAAGRAHLLRLPPLVARRQLFGEGEHGEDDEEHGDGAQEEAAPPGRDSRGSLMSTGSARVRGRGQTRRVYQLPTKRGSLWSMLTTVLGST